ncbi:MAG TPA: S9 family peptidase, partial [Niabella sp.]|nr:S9 family peptidase [Niabella sp.]
SKLLTRLSNEKVLHAQFSPAGDKIAYVMDNNLYLYDIADGKTTAITTDGKWNHIINGNCDWVYEEEFGFTQAYQWSPQGNYLAYYRFDESKVKEYSFTEYDNFYNKEYRYKYPKAGDDNSKIEIHIYNVRTGKDVKAQFEQGDIYIPRIKWTTKDNELVVFWMNRHQNNLKLLLTNPDEGTARLLYEETNKYYIDINDDWQFLKDGSGYLFTSEMNGYNNIYLYSMDGKKKTIITNGKYDITDIIGVDEDAKLIYYTAAYPTAMDRNVFVADFAGKNNTLLTSGEGSHRAVFSDDYKQFYDYYSNINIPQKVSLVSVLKKKNNITTKVEKIVSESEKLQALAREYNLGQAELVKVPNGKGDEINGWILKPANFDASKKYPVLFCNYGGPGSQQVANRYGAVSAWHQMLAQKGFIVASFDNTGTGYRGEEFKKKTYLQLGKYEIEDQIAAAKWMGTLPYVDKSHIGHWGWSYGGFMSSLAITKGADVFSAAVAVAPVTNWRFYDNIYTERYMRTPQENPDGYDGNSPINFTDKIRGKYLIIHGTADDNVHFQNATQMVTALVKNNIPFESAYYPNKNHGISGMADNTTIHLWTKMSNWILQNLGNENTDKTILK